MDSMTLTLALFVGISALIVDAQQNLSPPPPPPPPPPPSNTTPPPPPPYTSPPLPPLPRPSRRHLSPPPRENAGLGRRHLSPPPKKENLNTGKKVGLLFVGVGVILQVCVVAFLLITRRQLLKGENVW